MQLSPLFDDYMAEKMASLYGVQDWDMYNYILQDGSINPAYFMANENNVEHYYFPKINGIYADDLFENIMLPFQEYSGMSTMCYSPVEDGASTVPYATSIVLENAPYKIIPLSNNIVLSYNPAHNTLSPLFRDYFAEKMASIFDVANWDRYDYILEDGSINPEYLIESFGSTNYYYFPAVGIGAFEDLADYVLANFQGSRFPCYAVDILPSELTDSPKNTLLLHPKTFLQETSIQFTETYDYNIQGWLTGQKSDLFEMELKYFNPELTGIAPSYTGNITQWNWLHKDPQNPAPKNGYGFNYDKLSRLTDSQLFQQSGNQWQRSGCFEEWFGAGDVGAYDMNGNILSLMRSSATGSTMDEFRYEYNGNRLTKLYLDWDDDSNFVTYEYDANGNCITDGLNGLDLEYNFLNLVGKVLNGNQTVAEYRWLADGTKAGVKGYHNGSLSSGFEYLGSLVYRRDADGELSLESAPFGGGRFLVSETTDEQIYTPIYFITDHLGSTRVMFSHTGEVLDRSDYYPYGLKWEHPGAQASDNRWLYNGKELQTAGFPDGSNYLDYGARMYVPRIGRFQNPDPLSGLMVEWSPYGYCLGNPVRYIDFMGLTSVDVTYTLPTIVIPANLEDDGMPDPEWLVSLDTDEPKFQWDEFIAETIVPGLGFMNDAQRARDEGKPWKALGNEALASIDIGLTVLTGGSYALAKTGILAAARGIKQGARALKAARAANAANAGSKGLRSFTRSNFRHNLGKLTGGIPANSQAHHVFPVAHNDKFVTAGMNIHDPRFGVWWGTSDHLKNAAAYNAQWGLFFQTNANPTAPQIMDHGRYLMLEYGIQTGF